MHKLVDTADDLEDNCEMALATFKFKLFCTKIQVSYMKQLLPFASLHHNKQMKTFQAAKPKEYILHTSETRD